MSLHLLLDVVAMLWCCGVGVGAVLVLVLCWCVVVLG